MDIGEVLSARGLSLQTLGAAYLFLLGSAAACAVLFVLSRKWLVVTPNRFARYYGLYVVVVLVSLGTATVIENELVPQAAALHYAAVPQLAILLAIHLWIYYDQEPWLVSLGGSAVGGSVLAIGISSMLGSTIELAHWMVAALLVLLLGYLWRKSVSTKRAFRNASSIYIDSKELGKDAPKGQVPWLGLPQWVALCSASLALATLNATLRGRGLSDVPAAQVALESSLLLAATLSICAIPAAAYWLARKRWMPELTRFVWLVWIVVGFAFTYGNYLARLDRLS